MTVRLLSFIKGNIARRSARPNDDEAEDWLDGVSSSGRSLGVFFNLTNRNYYDLISC